jgi:hypothetical protein
MNLKSFGCSFIFGSELSDDGQKDQNDRYVWDKGIWHRCSSGSRLTWPAHLARHLGHNYITHARPGAGNLQIAETVLSHLTTDEQSLFVIGWTYIDRFDYVNTATFNGYPGTPWSTITPGDTADIATAYYKTLHSEIRDKLTTLMSIRLVIDTLKQKGCPFIMTYIDDLMVDTQWNTSPAITDLQDYIRPYMTTFEGLNFQQWSKKNGYPITAIGHPLESAHRAAGELMIKVFDTQNTIDHLRLS